MDTERTERDVEIDLNALEHRLATWRPATGGLDRDRMLFEAGRSAARADGRLQAWRIAAGALMLVSVGLAGLLVRERSQRLALTTVFARAVQEKPTHPAGEIVSPPGRERMTNDPFSSSSYYALTARFRQTGTDNASSDTGWEPEGRHTTMANPPKQLPQARPLQVRDLNRVLDL